MVQTVQITKTKFLELYAKKMVEDPVNTGTRIYGRTTEGQALNPDEYIVVWCNL